MQIAALAGGVGASKLLLGFSRVMDARALTVTVNTGDDIVLHGLHISPDLDIVTYTLANAVNPKTGWGLRDDTFHALEILKKYGREKWFNLGDRDLATHMHRTAMLRSGATLADAAESIRRAWGVKARLLPMCNASVPTRIRTKRGVLHFQEYMVKRRTAPVVKGIFFDGARKALPAPGVLEAIRSADGIVICPSNPLISIGPILAVPGIRAALRKQRERVVAVCPIVGGKSLKGPSDKMMRQMGFESSALGVARMYRDFVGTMIVDKADAVLKYKIEALGTRVEIRATTMNTLADKKRLARDVLAVVRERAGAAG